jgi:hypothetical protein
MVEPDAGALLDFFDKDSRGALLGARQITWPRHHHRIPQVNRLLIGGRTAAMSWKAEQAGGSAQQQGLGVNQHKG